MDYFYPRDAHLVPLPVLSFLSFALQLQTYMVWLPEGRQTTTSTSLPPVPQRRNERIHPARNCQTRMSGNFGYGQFTGLNQTTYQDEIARTPFLHRTGENNFQNFNNSGQSCQCKYNHTSSVVNRPCKLLWFLPLQSQLVHCTLS